MQVDSLPEIICRITNSYEWKGLLYPKKKRFEEKVWIPVFVGMHIWRDHISSLLAAVLSIKEVMYIAFDLKDGHSKVYNSLCLTLRVIDDDAGKKPMIVVTTTTIDATSDVNSVFRAIGAEDAAGLLSDFASKATSEDADSEDAERLFKKKYSFKICKALLKALPLSEDYSLICGNAGSPPLMRTGYRYLVST